jgi:hypothetical protein
VWLAGDGRRSSWRKYFVILFKTSNPHVQRAIEIATTWVSARSCSRASHRTARRLVPQVWSYSKAGFGLFNDALRVWTSKERRQSERRTRLN